MDFKGIDPEKVRALIAARTVEIEDTRKWLQETIAPLLLRKHTAGDPIEIQTAMEDITRLGNLDSMLKMLKLLLCTVGDGTTKEILEKVKTETQPEEAS